MTKITLEIPEHILVLMETPYGNPESILEALRKLNYKDIKSDDYRFETFMQALRDQSTFEARETRSWAEYLRDQLVEELENKEPLDLDPDETYDFVLELFSAYLMDGTFTYSTAKSIKFIREFWLDFNYPEEALNYHYNGRNESLFERPEIFFLQQIITDSNQLLYTLLKEAEYSNEVDDKWTTENLKETLKTMSAFELNNLLYE